MLMPSVSYEEAISDSEMAIICVGTPSREDGSFDLQYIFDAAERIAKNAKNDIIVVQKSTVPVGTGRRIENILKRENPNVKFDVVSCPEFLAEGSAVFDTLNIDRVIVGGDNEHAKQTLLKVIKSIDDLSKTVDLDKLSDFTLLYKKKNEIYNKIPFEERCINIGLESAELIKVTANAFLATKISFANSIARVCDEVGADVTEVMDGVGADHRIGRAFLYAGLGWGGGCFPKDTMGLVYSAHELGVDLPIIKETININLSQVQLVIRKIKSLLKENFENSTITILGLTFKPGTSDVRISPSIKLVNALSRFDLNLKIYDPKGMGSAEKEIGGNVYWAKSIEDALKDTNLVVLATEWPEFVNLNFKKVENLFRTKNVVDARNKWDKDELQKLGFNYIGVGR